MYRHYRKLIWLRRNREVLRSPHLDTKVQSNNQNYIIYWRAEGEEKVIVAANFNTGNKVVDIPVPNPGKWYEFLTDDSLETHSTTLDDYSIPGSSARIFCNVRDWPSSLISKVTQLSDKTNQATTFNLYQNYPNPFNPATNISFSIAEKNIVTLDIYDVLGREIRTLIRKKMDREVGESSE